MSQDDYDNRPASVMKSSRMLQSKVGTGTVKKEKVEKSQEVLDKAKAIFDFTPMAKEFLSALEKALENAEKRKDTQALLDELIEPVMQLKANAGMFNYDLLGTLTTIMLCFLEAIDDINTDVLDIANAHLITIKHIIENEITGTGDEHGDQFQEELKEACYRYFAKHGGTIDFSAEPIDI